jgi:hypothetical protein
MLYGIRGVVALQKRENRVRAVGVCRWGRISMLKLVFDLREGEQVSNMSLRVICNNQTMNWSFPLIGIR